MGIKTLRLEHFTDGARDAIVAAQTLADARKHALTMPLHLCLALIEGHDDASGFAALGARASALAAELREAIDALPNDASGPSYLAPATLEVLEQAEAAAETEGEQVHEQRLAWALGRSRKGVLKSLLRQHGIRATDLPPPAVGTCPRAVPTTAIRAIEGRARPDVPAFSSWEPTRERLAAALARSTDPVAVLVGAPGTGRTTFLTRFAADVAEGGIAGLEGHVPIELDVVELATDPAGPRRLREAITALGRHPRKLALLDHLDYIGPPRSRERALLLDALRPAMVRGALRAVLVVSPELYQASFASDPLFAARATRVDLAELDPAALHAILAIRAEDLERGGGPSVPAETLEAILRSGRADRAHRDPGAAVRALETATAFAHAAGREHVEPSDVVAVAGDELERGDERARLRDLEAAVGAEVQGQDAAVAAVCRRIRANRLGAAHRARRPDGVFVLVGPCGVGKSRLARSLTRALYGRLDHLVRFDLAEHAAAPRLSALIGGPRGLLEPGPGGRLIERVAAAGRGVLLLDNIDRAHPSVFHRLAEGLEEGSLCDGEGRRADLGAFTVLMTTHRAPDGADDEAMRAAAADTLPPELLGRLDAIVTLRALDGGDLRRIAERLVRAEIERWSRRGKLLSVADDVVTRVVEAGYDPQLGAHHLEPNLEALVVGPIGGAARSDAWRHAQAVSVTLDGERVAVQLAG